MIPRPAWAIRVMLDIGTDDEVGICGGHPAADAYRPSIGRGLRARVGSFDAFLDAHVADPACEPTNGAEYDELCAGVRLSCTYGMLLFLSRD